MHSEKQRLTPEYSDILSSGCEATGLNYSSTPSAPTANTLAELKDELELMLEALRKPVLLDARELGE